MDTTVAEINAKIEKLNEMSLAEYALSFGGLIISDERLIAYKAEYITKLTNLVAPTTCPDCGAPVERDDTADLELLMFRNAGPHRRVHCVELVKQPIVALFCTECEYSVNLGHRGFIR